MLALPRACIAGCKNNTFCNFRVSSLPWGRCINFRNIEWLGTKRNGTAFDHEFNSAYVVLQKLETYRARDCAWLSKRMVLSWRPRARVMFSVFTMPFSQAAFMTARFLQSASSKSVYEKKRLLWARSRTFTFAQYHSSCWIRVGRIRVHTIACIRQKANKSKRVNVRSRPR